MGPPRMGFSGRGAWEPKGALGWSRDERTFLDLGLPADGAPSQGTAAGGAAAVGENPALLYSRCPAGAGGGQRRWMRRLRYT